MGTVLLEITIARTSCCSSEFDSIAQTTGKAGNGATPVCLRQKVIFAEAGRTAAATNNNADATGVSGSGHMSIPPTAFMHSRSNVDTHTPCRVHCLAVLRPTIDLVAITPRQRARVCTPASPHMPQSHVAPNTEQTGRLMCGRAGSDHPATLPATWNDWGPPQLRLAPTPEQGRRCAAHQSSINVATQRSSPCTPEPQHTQWPAGACACVGVCS